MEVILQQFANLSVLIYIITTMLSMLSRCKFISTIQSSNKKVIVSKRKVPGQLKLPILDQ